MRASVLVAAAAACTGTPPPTPASAITPRTTETRTAPRPFFDVPGLSEVVVTSRHDDWSGTTTVSRRLISHGGATVCDVAAGRTSSHENHRSQSDITLTLETRRPLRFQLVEESTSWLEEPPSITCNCFELPEREMCRRIATVGCTETATFAITQRPGTGRVLGEVTTEGAPIFAATILAGGDVALSDEHGRFELALPAGTHPLQVVSYTRRSHRSQLVVTADADLRVRVEIPRCRCCP